MTISILGDSLTAGNLGIPYLRYLKTPRGTNVVNHGRDGDTVKGVSERLDDVIRADSPDVLVLEVGANDILLPEMEDRGGVWTPFIVEMKKQGCLPTPEPRLFAKEYGALISAAEAWGVPRICCVTIPPLGEEDAGERNARRRELNGLIRTAAKEAGACLIEAGTVFEEALAELSPHSDYFFTDPGQFITDKRRQRRDKSAGLLSEERGLFLTIDGAHLNERGAALFGRLVSEVLFEK